MELETKKIKSTVKNEIESTCENIAANKLKSHPPLSKNKGLIKAKSNIKKISGPKKIEGLKQGSLNFLIDWYKNFPYEVHYVAEDYTHFMKFSKKFEILEQEEFKELTKESQCIVLSSDYIKSAIIELESKITSKEIEIVMNFKVKTLYSASILAENSLKWLKLDHSRYLVNLVPKKLIDKYENFFGISNMPLIASDVIGMYNYILYVNDFALLNCCYISMSIKNTQIMHFQNGKIVGIDRFDIGLSDYFNTLEEANVTKGIQLIKSLKFFPRNEKEFESKEILENFEKIKKVHFDWVDKINSIKEYRKLKKDSTAFYLMGLESYFQDFDIFMRDYFESQVVIPKHGWRESRLIGTCVGMHF
ncbi:MAG: hypothetical protein NTX05_00585 [Fusobacteria bacterium]|nr:hypothetical protein [Fusobacteriota bacterium]